MSLPESFLGDAPTPGPVAIPTPRDPGSERLLSLLELADSAEDALDKDTYEQFRREELDLPDDCEMWITAGTVRKLFKVFAEIDRLKKPRFAETFCSQCGQSFGPGSSGFSHCDQHGPKAMGETVERT